MKARSGSVEPTTQLHLSRPHHYRHYDHKPPVYHPNSYNHYGTIDDYGNAEHGFSFVSPFAGYGYFGRRRSDFYHEPAPHYAQPREEIAVLIWISYRIS